MKRPDLPELPPLPERPAAPPEPRAPLRPLAPASPAPLQGGLRERRALRQKAIADLIAERPVRNQTELQELLRQRGLLVTQSSISRDLRDLGVRRVKGTYVIQPALKAGAWSFETALGLVEMVTRSGPHLTVVRTAPDAARLVARLLEESDWEEVVGTVAGDDTIFVATRGAEDQDRLFERFKKYLRA